MTQPVQPSLKTSSSRSNFNLLPQEVFKKRQQKKVSIDNTTVFSAVLPLVAILIWVVFTLLSSFKTREITTLNKNIKTKETEIAGYKDDKDLNAILVLKTRVLSEIVKKDVNPENFFNIVQNTIKKSGRNIKITAYGRESSGVFTISATGESIKDVTDITRIFRQQEGLSNVKIKNIRVEKGLFYFIMEFEIVEETTPQA